MKKILTALLLTFSTSGLWAQSSFNAYGFRLGLTAHPTIGWVKPQIGKSNSVSLGFSYGLLGDFNFAENYSFSTGLSITTINGKSTEVRSMDGGQLPFELKYKLQYIEVPLTIKLRTVEINGVRWFGQFGLSNGFNIGAKQDADVSGQAGYRDRNISDDIKFYRAGLVIGAGGETAIGGQASLAAGLTYNNGFTDITSDNSNNIRNHYVALNLAVFF